MKPERKFNNPMSKADLRTLKQNIKDQIKAKGKTIEEVCKILGYHRDHINKLENPSAGKLIDIARIINCEPSEFFKGI